MQPRNISHICTGPYTTRSLNGFTQTTRNTDLAVGQEVRRLWSTLFCSCSFLTPSGNATNPFTNETLPYTGYVPLTDFIDDKILPEMNILADLGTDIMWCDIGGPNKTAEFASAWYNRAAEENRQVVMNAR